MHPYIAEKTEHDTLKSSSHKDFAKSDGGKRRQTQSNAGKRFLVYAFFVLSLWHQIHFTVTFFFFFTVTFFFFEQFPLATLFYKGDRIERCLTI